MTALAIQQTYETDRLDWSMLVDAKQAASMLGVNRDHLTRLCREELCRKALAFFATPPSGGSARWWIDRRYDARLAPGAVEVVDCGPSLDQFTDRQRTQALQRRECVRRLRKARVERTGQQKYWLPRLIAELRREFADLKIARTSLLTWDRIFRGPDDLPLLVDQRGGDTRSKGSPEAWDAFEHLYLDQTQPTIKSCWSRVRDMARAHSWSWVSYKSCQRQLDERIAPEKQLMHRQPDKWRKQMQPYIAQDREAWAAGACWVGDHKLLDLWCLHGKQLIRPWITVWMDWRTRRKVGWVMTASPNSSTILAAFRAGMLDEKNHGGPSSVHVDCGKDYRSYALTGDRFTETRLNLDLDESQASGLFGMLGIEAHFSLAYNPNGKARLERWFRNTDDFASSFATYCGQKAADRPEYLNDLLRNKRHLVPTFKHVEDRFRDFVNGENARSEHQIDDLVDETSGGERLSPDQAMSRWCTTRRVMADPAVLDLLLQHHHKPVPVTRNGIAIIVAGRRLTYGQFDPALTPYKRLHKDKRPKLNVTYDPRDLRTIRVYTPDWRFITEAAMNRKGGLHANDAITRQHVADLNRDKRHYAKSLKIIRETRHHEYLTDSELLAIEARKDAAAKAECEQPLQIVQTPLDGQSKAVKKAAAQRRQRIEPVQSDVWDRLRNVTVPGALDPEAQRAKAQRQEECQRRVWEVFGPVDGQPYIPDSDDDDDFLSADAAGEEVA